MVWGGRPRAAEAGQPHRPDGVPSASTFLLGTLSKLQRAIGQAEAMGAEEEVLVTVGSPLGLPTSGGRAEETLQVSKVRGLY